jgi:hypothetical protein
MGMRCKLTEGDGRIKFKASDHWKTLLARSYYVGKAEECTSGNWNCIEGK